MVLHRVPRAALALPMSAAERGRWLHPSLVTARLGPDGAVSALDWGEGHILARRTGSPAAG